MKIHQFAAIAELTGGSSANDFKVVAPIALQDNPDLDVYIDWGDGTCNRITNDTKALATHTYSEIGKYRIRMKGTVSKFQQQAIPQRNNVRNLWSAKLKHIIELGDLDYTSLYYAFYYWTGESFANHSDTSNVTDFSYMFYYSQSSTEMIFLN